MAEVIGANTAVFSVVNGVLLSPLPFHEPERLVGVWHTAPGLGLEFVNQSPALYFTYREHSELFEDTGMWSNDSSSITGMDEPEQVSSIYVTDGTFPILRTTPLIGRMFSAEDDSPEAPSTVVLSHRYWQERFGGNPSILGTSLQVDGTQTEIIGVTRTDLHFLDFDPAIYLPFQFDRGEVFFGNFSYQGIARLKPGVTLEQVDDEMARMIQITIETFPLPGGFSAEMIQQIGFGPAVRPLKQDVVGNVGSVLWVLLGTVGLVLLIACANVANLFLVRAEGRQQELAIRTALGASRGRLARELLGESLMLGLLGGAAGLALAAAGIRFLVALQPQGLPRLDEIGIDPAVLGFTLLLSVLAGLFFGTFPIAKMGTARLVDALKEGGRGGSAGRQRHRVRNALVVAQVALALVLLVGSGLMIRSFRALRDVDPGFRDPQEVLTLRVTIPSAEVPDNAEAAQLHETLLRSIQAIPGVRAAGMTSSITMDGWDSNDPILREDSPPINDEMPPLRRFKWIAPGYFETMGNTIVSGRDFTWADLHDRIPVAILTEDTAREFWTEPSAAIGQRIKNAPESPWREVVGVVGNIHDDGVDQPTTKTVFWPMVSEGFWGEGLFVARSMAFVVRSERIGTPGLLDEIRSTIWDANASLPLAQVRTLQEILDRSMARTSFTLTMLGIAAVAAVLLGAIGIYGVTSYIVSQRTREIGVRMAMGALQADISQLVLRQAAVLALVGVGLGLTTAFGLTRLMASLLYGVSPVDPMTFSAVAVGVTTVALLASYLPARRAARVEPVEALRWD